MKVFSSFILIAGLILGSCNNNSNNNASQPDAQTGQQNNEDHKHGEKGNGGGNGESKEKKELQEQLAAAQADLAKNEQQRTEQATALTQATEELNRLKSNHALQMGGGDRAQQIAAQSAKVDQIKANADNLADAGAKLQTQVNDLKAKLDAR